MGTRMRSAVAGLVVVGATLGGGGLAIASSDDAEPPIAGPDLEHASQVAVQHLGGGRVTGTEVGDEESYYEVEVTRHDGTQVDVQLDRNFNVVGGAPDVEDDAGDEPDGR